MTIIPVDNTNIIQAAEIHSISWKESHRAFCTPEFIEKHTPERQREYLQNKMNGGAKVYMLTDEKPLGIVSVTGSLIEDLYVLPEMQNRGYGTALLQFAIKQCTNTPVLWILENNTGAERLYHRMGFHRTGKRNCIANGLDEIEMHLNGAIVCGKAYRVLRLLGHGKGGYSYLAESDGQQVVLKQIHHEPCDYYAFGNKIEAEQRDYERLQAAGIRIPRMLAIDVDAERVVKEYIEGPTIFELVKSGTSAAPWLAQVRDMAARAKAAGLNIDYFPTNFVVRDGLIWYVDYECNEYMDEWSFENWGIRYWSRTPEFEAYLKGRTPAVTIQEERVTAEEYIGFLRRTDLGSQYPKERFEERIARLVNTVSISLTARNDQGLLVGVLFGLTDYAYWLYITDLGVDRDYTRQGIGRRLMKTAHQLAGGEKDIAVYLIANENAVPFYEKCGMKRADDVMQYNHIEWTQFTVT